MTEPEEGLSTLAALFLSALKRGMDWRYGMDKPIPKPETDALGLPLPPPVRDGQLRFEAALKRLERRKELRLATMAEMGISTVEKNRNRTHGPFSNGQETFRPFSNGRKMGEGRRP